MEADDDAELARIHEVAIASPAAAAACEIAAAACNQEAFPLLGFSRRVWLAEESFDEFAHVRLTWTADGRDYQLHVGYHVVTGEGTVGLVVDGDRVMDILVEMCGWEKPPRLYGGPLPEDAASPDGKICGLVTGGHRYRPGPWEAELVRIAEQVRRPGAD